MSVWKSQILDTDTGTFINPARVGDPDYHTSVELEVFSAEAFQDDQTTPAKNSTDPITQAYASAPIYHAYVEARAVSAAGHAALYATDRSGSTRVVLGPITVSDTSYLLLDLGIFQLNDGETAYLRVWGSGTGVIVGAVVLVIRPDEYPAAFLIDGSAPAWVHASGAEAVNDGEPVVYPASPSITYNPFLHYPPPAHPELVEMGARHYTLPGDPSGGRPFFTEQFVNGTPHIGDNFSYSYGPADSAFTWVQFNFLPAGTIASPGDDLRMQAYGGWSGPAGFTYTQDSLHVVEGFIAKQMEDVAMVCDGTLTVGYSHPHPASISHWEARVYYYNGGVASMILRNVPSTNVTANPYTFSALPPTGLADPEYFLVMRAYYYDGSWNQWGCLYTPPARHVPVFRNHLKAHH